MFDTIERFFDNIIFKPLFDQGISELYSGSILETAVEGVTDVLDYELFSRGDPTGNVGAGSPVTVGGVLKDFAGGFLNIGQGPGGSGIYGGPTQMPAPTKISAKPSTAGRGQFKATPVDMAKNYGFTNNVQNSLVKSLASDVPSVQQFLAQIQKNADRRQGVKSVVGTQVISGVKRRTPSPLKLS
jgi:hypothetical protein